jgi:hypothetical protein
MARPDESSLTERQRYWLNHIRACDASGQATIDYAREHGINVKSLYSARKALAAKGTLPPTQPTRFQKVQVVGGNRASDGQWHIQLPNGLAVSFGGAVDAATLSLVLSTAAALS